jgi:hypothetical protein
MALREVGMADKRNEDVAIIQLGEIRMRVTLEDGVLRDVVIGGYDIAHLLSEEACDEIHAEFINHCKERNAQ